MNRPTDHAAFVLDSPTAAITAMSARLAPVDTEALPMSAAAGRVLAEPLIADRPSPACDVSAMDGYAVRLNDLALGWLPVAGDASMGRPPLALPARAALRIFTGAAVPAECEAVIPREQVDEHADAIRLPRELAVQAGQHIRRRGENGRAGETVVARGTAIRTAVAAALAAFGVDPPVVYRRVRVAALVTGDEVRDVTAAVALWQLRDSNGPALAALFASHAWIHWIGVTHVPDDRTRLRQAAAAALDESDAVLLTGGVSMGDYDYVPAVLAELGCEIVFHKLPIRPGKPVLGAIGPRGQAVLGLPGNPVSVMATGRRIALPVLRKRAGHAVPDSPVPVVSLTNPDTQRLALRWSRPVRLIEHGRAELVPTRGSGDVFSAARSDGFVEIPPNQEGSGPWPFYRWSGTDE